ncbi:hypothetical protein ACH4XT_36870 [Streptomyces avidinii]
MPADNLATATVAALADLQEPPAKGQAAREQIFDGLLSRLDGEGSWN